jgi:Fe-S-cluster containining protein
VDDGTILPRKENGDCVHLGAHGCTIYGQHPTCCKLYLCTDDVNEPREDIRAAAMRIELGLPGKATHEN